MCVRDISKPFPLNSEMFLSGQRKGGVAVGHGEEAQKYLLRMSMLNIGKAAHSEIRLTASMSKHACCILNILCY